MINIYIQENSSLHLTEEIQNGSWIKMVSPVAQEIDNISLLTNIDKRYFTDTANKKMVEMDKTVASTFLKIKDETYRIILSDKYVITICDNEIANHDSEDILHQFIKGIIQVILKPKFATIDITELFQVMKKSENMRVTIGYGKGENKIEYAIEMVSAIPNGEVILTNTKGIFMALIFSSNVERDNINKLVNNISKKTNPFANVIYGAVLDEVLEDEIKVLLMVSEE